MRTHEARCFTCWRSYSACRCEKPRFPVLGSEDERVDLSKALERRDEGIARVSQRNGSWVALAQATARMIALERGTVTADDVRAVLYPQGLKPKHYNAWGGVFKKGFRWTGLYRRSAVVKGHGNMQRVWEVG